MEISPFDQQFANKVRLRICGVLCREDRILLIRHQGIGPAGFLWSPPGGGVQFGESITTTLKREFLEEAGLDVEVQDFLFFHEHISDRLHAVELFFKVTFLSGQMALGLDPELPLDQQILTEIRYWSPQEISNQPELHFHACISKMWY